LAVVVTSGKSDGEAITSVAPLAKVVQTTAAQPSKAMENASRDRPPCASLRRGVFELLAVLYHTHCVYTPMINHHSFWLARCAE
ncbi:hypothetical protein KXV68_001364, partial [Aspergillus fumigatus]